MTPDLGTIRLVIVDDHAIVRRGLSDFFATCDDIEVVGEAGDGTPTWPRLTRQASPSPRFWSAGSPRREIIAVGPADRAIGSG